MNHSLRARTWIAVAILLSATAAATFADEPAAIAALKKKLGTGVGVGQERPVTSITLTGDKVTDEDMKLLKNFPQLQTLTLGSSAVTDAGMAELKHLPQLSLLSLHQTKITAAGFRHLRDCRGLDRLFLTGPNITNDCLREIGQMKQLTVLNIAHTAFVSDEGVKEIKDLTGLTVLVLAGTKVTDAGLTHIKGLKQLAALNLSDTEITDAGLKEISRLPRIERLDLRSNRLTDACVNELSKLPRVNHLILVDTDLTDAGLEKLRKALPNCYVTPDSVAAPRYSHTPRSRPTDKGPLPAGAVRLGTPRLSRGSPIVSMTLSLDAQTLVAHHIQGDERGQIVQWDLKSGRSYVVTEWDVVPAFSPSGKQVSFVGMGGSSVDDVPLETGSRSLMRSQQYGGNVWASCQAWSPDGTSLATGADGIELWNPATARRKLVLADKEKAECLAYSPDCKLIASSCKDGALHVWEIATKKLLLDLGNQQPKVTALAFTPDGKHVVSAAIRVAFWDLATGKLSGVLPEEALKAVGAAEPSSLAERAKGEDRSYLAFSPDGQVLATARGNVIRLWDWAERTELRRVQGHRRLVRGLAFRDGKTLVSASLDGTFRLWDISTGKEVEPAGGHEESVTAVAFAPDGKLLASASYDGSVRLWDVGKAREVAAWRDLPPIKSLAWTGDGKLLAAGATDGTVILWNAEARKELWRIPGPADKWAVNRLTFAAASRFLVASGASATIRICDVAAGRERARLKGNEEQPWPILDLAAGPGEGQVTAVDSLLNVRTWDIAAEKMVTETRLVKDKEGGWILPMFGAVFSADAKQLAVSLFRQHRGIVNLGDPTGIKNVSEKQEQNRESFLAAFDPTGRQLAIVGSDGTITLLEAGSGKEIKRFNANRGPVGSIAFSRDGRWLAVGNADTSIVLWDSAR